MPTSKSSRSSKSSRPSLLSLPSVSNLLSTVSHSKEYHHDEAVGLGQPEKVHRAGAVVKPRDDDYASKPPQRSRSKMNVLTSLFTPTRSDSTKPSLLATDNRRPKTAHEALPPSHIRETPIHRKPVASTLEFSTYSSLDDNSPRTPSNARDSRSTVDNSPDGGGLGVHTPATQVSDFDFGFERTDSPESAGRSSHGQSDADMPAVIQKHQRGASSPPDRAPPVPPKLELPPQQNLTFQMTETPASPILSRKRSSSAHPRPTTESHDGRNRLQPSRRPSSPAVAPRPRSSSAHSHANHSRTVSTPVDQRTLSKNAPDGDGRGRLRRSWLPGGRSRSASKDLKKMPSTTAWIMSQDNQADYSTQFLTNGDKVPELWNENGTVLVYLFPKSSGKGPSFKIPAQSVEASIVFHELIQGELENIRAEGNVPPAEDSPALPQTFGIEAASGEVRLYIPPPGPNHEGDHDQLQRLVALRNLFAFLTGQPLVGTKAHPTIFSAFLEISALLKEFDFMSMDGTTWGEAVDMSFGFYISQMALADVRHSREKTLEAIILGERMKCWELYNEAYTHAVGKWQAIVSLKSPLLKRVTPGVQRRLERSNLDLLNRQHNVNQRLDSFDFPALFAGVAASSEFKDVRFNRWRAAFAKMRFFTLDHYKSLFGAWPPKARSKKNPFSESGLNRLVLKALYADLCSLYDLLVDRDSITPRVIDQSPDDEPDKEADLNIKALRKLLNEFDQSSPPVLPPIPFDIPKIPTMKTVQANYDEMKEKDRLKFDRNIKDHELQLIMHKSYNFDTDRVNTSFLEQFKDFDFEHAKGKNAAEIADHRLGVWLFLYVVIQSLPLLVVDAPDLQFTEGVEYFLCQPPMGNPPWIEDAGEVRKAWYQIPGSSVKVELSADVVMFSVEGTFERSHCWEMAKLWDETKLNGGSTDLLGIPAPGGIPAAENLMPLSPLEAPRAVFEDMDPVGQNSSNAGSSGTGSAPASPAQNPQRRTISPGSGLAQGRGSGSGYRASFAGVVGLEMLPPPMNVPVDRRSTRVYSAQAHAQSDSLSARPMSSAGGDVSGPQGSLRSARSSGNLRSESPARAPPMPTNGTDNNAHNRTTSSTFDDILKDMSGQQTKNKTPKKRFGF